MPKWAKGKNPSFVTMVGGVIGEHDLGNAGPIRGKLSISSAQGDLSVRINQETAHRGLLLGAYERCHSKAVSILSCDGISRVHLLLLDIAGELYAIDTGSTNGVYLVDEPGSQRRSESFMAEGTDVGLPGQRIRSVRLEAGATLLLGHGYACLRWAPSFPV